MKKTIALAAVALMCGTSVYAQTTSPDQTTKDQQSNTQVHGQPTIEPGAGGAVSSTEAGKMNAGDTTSSTTMTTGAGTAANPDNTTKDQQSNTQVHGQPTIEPGAAGAVSSTEAGKMGQDSSTGATMSTGTTGAGTMSDPAAAGSTTTTTTTGTTTTGTTTTGADMSATTSASTGAGNSASLAQFDANNDGSLTPLEFAQLVMSTRAPASGNTGLVAEAKRERFSKAGGNGAIKLLNETARDFGMADKNMDKRIDSSELAMWQPGAAPNM